MITVSDYFKQDKAKWSIYTSKMANTILDFKHKFEQKFIPEPNSGCWIWTDFVKEDGYGAFHYNAGKRSYISTGAHRASYQIYNGEIPSGLLVCHKCDTKSCVNPKHLFLGTYSDNILDLVGKGKHNSPNKVKTHCKYGHEFTEENTRKHKNKRQCKKCQHRRVTEWRKLK